MHTRTVLLTLLVAIASAAVAPGAQASPSLSSLPAMAFGMDSYSLKAQTEAGVTPDYATFWVGPWNLKDGWGAEEKRLKAVRDAGVTPAIHLYYWGDDISKSCLKKGCHSDLHGTRKDQAGWDRLTEQLLDKLEKHMDGQEVVIFLETEFNKGNVATYEPLDAALAEKAERIHERHPEAHVVLSLGTWGTEHWGTWDRAAAASDAIGLQAMRASTVDSEKRYMGLFGATLKATKTAQKTFEKPIFLQDIALSSYGSGYKQHQATALSPFFDRMDELKAAGVEAVVYRSWRDAPNMDVKNYYGKAERHWGLAKADGTLKPSAEAWVAGVQSERADPVSAAKLSVQAEAFETLSTGGLEKQKGASGGKAWNLWADGHATTTLALEPGTHELSVRARGTTLGGVGPVMKVYVDGEKVLTAEPGKKFESHTAVVTVDGPAELRISYGNDSQKGKEDRNLILDAVTVTPA